MRITRLDLTAFGPFTGRSISFDSSSPGLHIIYGPNEAGKSSSLRGLKALLYGFPERTTDNFQHANPQLLVGGSVEGADGKELSFQRRKKRKGDLLDADGEPLEEHLLQGFLHGMEPELFEAVYGIDHKSLIEGGEDILAQKGEIGQALFAAGSGVSSLRNILDSLDAEADELFRERGSKQQITLAIKEYRELKKSVKENSLLPTTWREFKQGLQEAETERALLEEEYGRKNNEVKRLERLQTAQPQLAKLENLQGQLKELGEVVKLPPHFGKELQEVEQTIRENKLTLDGSRERLAKLREKQKGISLNQPLLEQAERVKDLHQRIGEFRKGQQDGDKLEGMRITHRKEAGAILETIRPDLKLDNVEELRPILNRKGSIQDLRGRFEAITQQASQASRQKDVAEQELAACDDKLSRLPAVKTGEGLALAVALARKPGDIDQHIDTVSREIRVGKKNCQTELSQLGLWSGNLEQLVKLELPLIETIRRYQTMFEESASQRGQLSRDRQRVEVELRAARSDSRQIEVEGDIPSEQDLDRARGKRQDGWQLLRRQWLDGEGVEAESAVYDPEQSLPEAYESSVKTADFVGDRLRREAARVAKAAALMVQIEGLEDALQELGRLDQMLRTREDQYQLDWLAQWQSLTIKARSPQEMLSWLTDILVVRMEITGLFTRESELIDRKKEQHHHRQSLIDELSARDEQRDFAGDELAPVLGRSESVLEDISRLKIKRDRLEELQLQRTAQLEKARLELTAAERARLDWQQSWERALADLDMKGQLLPAEASDVLDSISECFIKLGNARDLRSRIKGIERDASRFLKDVTDLVKQVTPELTGLPPDQAALQLHALAAMASQSNDLLQKNNLDIELLQAEIEQAEKSRSSLEARLAELMSTARCRERFELSDVIDRFEGYRRLTESISQASSSLAMVSEGVPLDEIKRQSSKVDFVELPGRIDSLNRYIKEDLYPRLGEAHTRYGERNQVLKQMDGSAEAAEAAERMVRVGARIRRLVDQYVLSKLAGKVLQDEIERYREEHQDPVLKIASTIFSEITLDSFSGLRTDIDEKAQSILVGLRQDGSRVAVESMSDGTCDQLYLALRLATLEYRSETSEPMPFIVDDILVNFDDDRSRATLKALANLSAKNQVILFTHHQQVVEDAVNLQGEADVVVHEL